MNETNKTNKAVTSGIILLVLAVIIGAAPLFLIKDSEFGGADGSAGDLVLEINESYEPWFEPIWAPPGGETESLLFCLQAALGSGVFFGCIGYLIGIQKGKARGAA
ncbi:MAG: energy-coupling factor ABC transporter substrate-binding protein [Spirochaetaceae bacterium]|jgi:cobalt/nickel transport protein|nr:energy-coupling factor ABC transporter substrate-binding protein [Spirochaetaceae bacterium]